MGYSPWGQKESDTTERLSRLLLLLPRNNDSTMTWKLKSLLEETEAWRLAGVMVVPLLWSQTGNQEEPASALGFLSLPPGLSDLSNQQINRRIWRKMNLPGT